MRSLKDRVAVVTGASVGIGRALSIALAREGAKVILVARNPEGLEETRRLAGERAVAHPLDLASTSAIRTLADFLDAEYGRIDILWNGASGWLDGPLEGTPTEDLIAFVDGSIRGPIVLTSVLMPLLLKADSPNVINVSADWEFPQLEGLAPFLAAKRSLAAFGIALQKEKYGSLRVTNLHPADVASKDFAYDASIAEVLSANGGAAIPLMELIDIVLFILKLEGAIVHQIDVKPLVQDIGITFL